MRHLQTIADEKARHLRDYNGAGWVRRLVRHPNELRKVCDAHAYDGSCATLPGLSAEIERALRRIAETGVL